MCASACSAASGAIFLLAHLKAQALRVCVGKKAEISIDVLIRSVSLRGHKRQHSKPNEHRKVTQKRDGVQRTRHHTHSSIVCSHTDYQIGECGLEKSRRHGAARKSTM